MERRSQRLRPVAERLDATLVNMRFVKPLDAELVAALAATHQAVVTIEDNALAGGAGSAVGELLAATAQRLPQLHLGLPGRLDEASLRRQIEDLVGGAGCRHRSVRPAPPDQSLRSIAPLKSCG